MTFRPSTCVPLVGVGLLGWLLFSSDWTSLRQLFSQVNVSYLYAMPVYTASLIAVRAWRWNILLTAQGDAFTPWQAYTAYASGIFIGTFTPGRLGDLSRALYVRYERDVSWESALAGAILDRFFDVAFMSCLAIWAVVHLDLWEVMRPIIGEISGVSNDSGLVFASLLSVLLVGALSALLAKGLIRRLKAFAYTLKKECWALVQSVGWKALALTVVAYTIYFAQTVALARGLSLPLESSEVIASVVLVGLASFLPLSVAGLGTREGGLALIMAHRAVPDSLEASLAYSALFFAFCFLVPGLLGFVCFWQRPLSWQVLRRSTSEALNVGDD